MTLTAFVLGSGFAGQGHVMALRDNGVEIVGIASRTQAVVERVARDMRIPFSTTDWQQGLAQTQPDIVAVGTPGGAHLAPILVALEQGAHVFCDKPLAPTAGEARHLYKASLKAGVRTAYCASYRYMPDVLLAKEMIGRGDIGKPVEIDAISYFGLNPLIPFGWSHRLDQGGGRLNNNFPHKLSIVLSVLNGDVVAVSGTTRSDLKRAPVVEGVHHFRERHSFAPASADEDGIEWAGSDSDWSYTVLAKILTPLAANPVTTLFKHSGLQHRFNSDHITFYGTEGAIRVGGHYGHGPLSFKPGRDGWVEVEVPKHIMVKQPAIDDDTQRNWTLLAREFVADICGEQFEPYPTFHDGWLYQEIIDVVRADDAWTKVSHLSVIPPPGTSSA